MKDSRTEKWIFFESVNKTVLKPVDGVFKDLKGVHKERKGPIWSWFVWVFPVDERIGPEEVDSGRFKGCAKGDFLEPPKFKVFDSGFLIDACSVVCFFVRRYSDIEECHFLMPDASLSKHE